jgi:hypothetical protein
MLQDDFIDKSAGTLVVVHPKHGARRSCLGELVRVWLARGFDLYLADWHAPFSLNLKTHLVARGYYLHRCLMLLPYHLVIDFTGTISE